ncbi:hypothetical protein BH24ACT3_BH24ACT3_16970 [soil metagenome]
MSVLWALPPIIILAGVVAIVLVLRQAATVAAELRLHLTQLGEVREAVVALRAETAVSRATLERVRHQ